MTPNAASPTAVAVVALVLLGSLSPATSFVPTPSWGQQVPRHSTSRSASRLSNPPHMSTPPCSRRQRQPPSCFAPTAAMGHQRNHQQQHRRTLPRHRVPEGFPAVSLSTTPLRLPALRPLSVGGEGLDGIDPLEEGPDPDAILLQGEPEMLRQQREEEEYEAELAEAAVAMASSKKAPTKKQIAEEAVAAAVAQMGVNEEGPDRADDAVMASLDPKRRKSSRVKIDPLMPRGGVAPNEWAEMENLEEGCRGILVVCHTGLPRDKKRATALIQAVKDRYGRLIHTVEWWDEDPELTEDDREEMGTFEVWLEGPTVVHYHERADGGVDLDDEQMNKILDDLECRVVDEAILGQYVTEDLQFLLPGFRPSEQRRKQFPVL